MLDFSAYLAAQYITKVDVSMEHGQVLLQEEHADIPHPQAFLPARQKVSSLLHQLADAIAAPRPGAALPGAPQRA